MRDAPGPRARQYRCQMRGFGRRQLCRRMMEVGLRRRLDTVDAGTDFGDVEIDLENALLRPQCFDQDRVVGFDAFAKITAARPQEQILRGLLADGRCAARALRDRKSTRLNYST